MNENNQSEIMSQLNKACQLYAHGIHVNTRDHFAHFRMAVVLEELYHLQDIFGIKDEVVGCNPCFRYFIFLIDYLIYSVTYIKT